MPRLTSNLTIRYFLNPTDLNWGPKYGWIWVGSNLLSCLWIYFFIPETFMRTLEEIEEMFEHHVPARKWRTYECIGVANVVHEELKGGAHASEVEEARVGE